MGLFSSSDPVKQEEKLITKEAKRDDSTVKSALNDLSRAQKQEHAAAKDHEKVIHSHEKALSKEHKLAEAANAAVHKANEATSQEQKLAKEIQIKEQHHRQLEQEVAAKQKALEQVSHKHDINDAAREERRHHLESSHNGADRSGDNRGVETNTNTAGGLGNTQNSNQTPVNPHLLGGNQSQAGPASGLTTDARMAAANNNNVGGRSAY